MKFLFDQNFDRRLLRPLREQGQDVTVVGLDYQPGIADAEILDIALREERVILTNDRDFGDLVVSQGRPHAGIIYLRLRRTSAEAKWQRLNQVLIEHAANLRRFLVVTEATVRIRS